MKKRLKKKMYKEVLRAKEDLARDLWRTLAEGFFQKSTRSTRRGVAIRKVVHAGGGLHREWRDWEFWLPETHKAMLADASYKLPLAERTAGTDTVTSTTLDALAWATYRIGDDELDDTQFRFLDALSFELYGEHLEAA